ncbi:MAG: bL35 family ribosomal protein [Phycisphaerae bacterium]|jgi:large subunit ribosomal protein L35|nr:bL35 family ribosomal protein [Phycisphaerae bacterium]
MPKMKTRKSIAKRVKITGRGKALVRRGGSSHLKSTNSPKRNRTLRLPKALSKGFAKQAKKLMGK